MTDKTEIVVIERGMNVIIVKEKEGKNKKGEPKQTRISTFKQRSAVEDAINYLSQKLSVRKD